MSATRVDLPALTNADMRPDRFARWAAARRKAAWIASCLAAGRVVYVITATRATKIDARHADAIKATKGGLLLRSGRSWVSDYCRLEAHNA